MSHVMKSSLSIGNRFSSLQKRVHYEMMIFLFLMINFIVFHPAMQNMNDMMATLYLFSYQDMGFNSRFFIGSVFRLFFKYISAETLYFSICFIITCFNALVAFSLGSFIRDTRKDRRPILGIWVILFLANPFSLSFLYDYWNFGYLDLYLVGLTFIMILCIKFKKMIWLLPILCLIAMAIHTAWIFLYMPVVIIILFYECYKSNFKVSSIILLVSTVVILVTSLMYFQFFTPDLDFKSTEDVIGFLSERTNLKLSFDYIMANYFLPTFTVLPDALFIIKSWALPYTINVFVITTPIILVFLNFWLRTFKKAENNHIKRIVLLCIIAPVVTLPMFAFMDWDRWICAIFIVQFLLFFYFWNDGLECVVMSAKEIHSFFKAHSLLFLLVVIFLSTQMFSLSRPLYYHLQTDMLDFFNEMVKKHVLSVS